MVIHWAQIKQYADKQSENTQHKTENYQKQKYLLLYSVGNIRSMHVQFVFAEAFDI
jgi:hypothetical protein